MLSENSKNFWINKIWLKEDKVKRKIKKILLNITWLGDDSDIKNSKKSGSILLH